jgi:hypothetical protein
MAVVVLPTPPFCCDSAIIFEVIPKPVYGVFLLPARQITVLLVKRQAVYRQGGFSLLRETGAECLG